MTFENGYNLFAQLEIASNLDKIWLEKM